MACRARNYNSNLKPVLQMLEKAKTTQLNIYSKLNRISTQEAHGKTTRSPSRIVPPKRYSMTAGAPTTTAVAATVTTPTARARTPTSRVAVTAPNTPKRRVQSPRLVEL